MKIKQIRRTAPELYLVTYTTRWLKREVERYVIAEPGTRKVHEDQPSDPLPPLYETFHVFKFRDSGAWADDCWHQIEWMIRNEIDFFDNDERPEHDWPRGDKECTIASFMPDGKVKLVSAKDHGIKPELVKIVDLPVRNVPDFNGHKPLPKKMEHVLTLEQWESREPRVFITPATTDQWAIDDAQKSIREITAEFFHGNGRFERDLEYAPVLKEIEKAIDTLERHGGFPCTIRELSNAIADIPPLNPTEPK